MTTLNFDNYKLNIKNMSIKRFNDINDSDSVIDILKKICKNLLNLWQKK